MKVVIEVLKMDEVKKMAALFGGMVKAVVDIDKRILAVDAELHSDLEALLLENGSKQKNLWGINLYPDAEENEFIEFDSIINMRPSQGNRSRGIEDGEIRKTIIEIVRERIR